MSSQPPPTGSSGASRLPDVAENLGATYDPGAALVAIPGRQLLVLIHLNLMEGTTDKRRNELRREIERLLASEEYGIHAFQLHSNAYAILHDAAIDGEGERQAEMAYSQLQAAGRGAPVAKGLTPSRSKWLGGDVVFIHYAQKGGQPIVMAFAPTATGQELPHWPR